MALTYHQLGSGKELGDSQVVLGPSERGQTRGREPLALDISTVGPAQHRVNAVTSSPRASRITHGNIRRMDFGRGMVVGDARVER